MVIPSTQIPQQTYFNCPKIFFMLLLWLKFGSIINYVPNLIHKYYFGKIAKSSLATLTLNVFYFYLVSPAKIYFRWKIDLCANVSATQLIFNHKQANLSYGWCAKDFDWLYYSFNIQMCFISLIEKENSATNLLQVQKAAKDLFGRWKRRNVIWMDNIER